MSIRKKPQAWQVRKIAYGLAAVIVGVLGWVGVLSDIKADQVLDQVDQWLPILLGVLAPALAATKTHPGSDSTATDKDVAEQTADAIAAKVEELKAGAPDVAATLKELAKTIPEQPTPAKIADAVLAAIRAEENGEHFTATDPTAMVAAMKTEATRTDYVYGR